MISSRRALTAHLRTFFEVQLCGLLPWDTLTFHEPEPAPALENGRRNPLGRHKQIVTVSFGSFVLTAESPDEEPPLGWVKLMHDGDLAAEGPLDPVIWDNIGRTIKERLGYGGRR